MRFHFHPRLDRQMTRPLLKCNWQQLLLIGCQWHPHHKKTRSDVCAFRSMMKAMALQLFVTGWVALPIARHSSQSYGTS